MRKKIIIVFSVFFLFVSSTLVYYDEVQAVTGKVIEKVGKKVAVKSMAFVLNYQAKKTVKDLAKKAVTDEDILKNYEKVDDYILVNSNGKYKYVKQYDKIPEDFWGKMEYEIDLYLGKYSGPDNWFTNTIDFFTGYKFWLSTGALLLSNISNSDLHDITKFLDNVLTKYHIIQEPRMSQNVNYLNDTNITNHEFNDGQNIYKYDETFKNDMTTYINKNIDDVPKYDDLILKNTEFDSFGIESGNQFFIKNRPVNSNVNFFDSTFEINMKLPYAPWRGSIQYLNETKLTFFNGETNLIFNINSQFNDFDYFFDTRLYFDDSLIESGILSIFDLVSRINTMPQDLDILKYEPLKTVIDVKPFNSITYVYVTYYTNVGIQIDTFELSFYDINSDDFLPFEDFSYFDKYNLNTIDFKSDDEMSPDGGYDYAIKTYTHKNIDSVTTAPVVTPGSSPSDYLQPDKVYMPGRTTLQTPNYEINLTPDKSTIVVTDLTTGTTVDDIPDSGIVIPETVPDPTTTTDVTPIPNTPGGEPGTGTETPTPNPDEPPTDWGKKFSTLITKQFPFSLPWDLYYVLKFLNAEPKTPEFDVDTEVFNMPFQFHADLHAFDDIAPFVRGFIVLGFCLMLILITRKIMGGGV